MATEEKILELGDIQLQYFKYGKGEKNLVTLHGFGRDYFDFKFFSSLSQHYTIYGINLLFHGKSNPISNPNKPYVLKKQEWKKFFEVFIAKENIHQFDLLSYSMGGKFAFCLLENFAKKTNKAMFLAPDGILINRWYILATHTLAGKVLSRTFAKSNLGIPHLLNLSTYLGITKSNLKKFVEYNVSDAVKRQKIHLVWQSFKNIKPNHKLITQQISEHPTQILVVLGKYDVAIKASYAQFISKTYGNLAEVKILPLGHNLFKPETQPLVSDFFA